MTQLPLNAAQQRAVEYAAGPVAVLAGPGTGKTRVIVRRVEHMVQQRNARAENILAVTYTVKAAGELRDRLAHTLGPSAADRVSIHTFHGLGMRLLRRFADLAGLPAEIELIDAAQRRRLARDLIAQHRLFPDRAAEGRNVLAARFEAYLELFADNAISPERAAEAAEQSLRRTERNDAGLDGDPLAAARARAADFAQTARLYDLFTRECRRRGWVSFGDLLLLPLSVLSRHRSALAYVRQDYRHIVVDEFQDANTAQIELLRVLAPAAANPDLCVVGDDDQSIYEFRGADDLAFRRFARFWPDHHLIQLDENYRSHASIITAANASIGRAAFRFAPDKKVRPAGAAGGPCPGAGVECVELEDDKFDGEAIAAMIRADRLRATQAGDHNPAAEPRAWSDYAVIARTHGDLERVAAALDLEGIPCVRQRTGSALDDAGVADVLAWIELLTDPTDAHAAQRLLMRPPLRLIPSTAAELLNRYRSMAARARLNAGDDPAPIVPPVAPWLAGLHPAADSLGDGLRRFRDRFAVLADVAASASADEAIYRIVALTGVAEADLLGPRDRARRVAALVSLVRFARARQSRLEAPGDLAAFWSYFQDLDAGSRDRLGEAQALDAADALSEDAEADGVRLITAHSAKGLEFDTVFLPRVTPVHGYGGSRGRDDELELPDGLIDRDGDERGPKERQAAEERRVFYVACTRARRRLVMLAKRNKNPSKSTHFFEEFTRDPAGSRLVSVRDQATVLRETAALAGAREVSLIERAAPDLAARGTREEVLARARRAAREQAARALDAAEAGDAGAALDVRLIGAAEMLRAIAEIERTGQVPSWADGETADAAAALVHAITGPRASEHANVAAALAAPPSPLELSFTAINAYEQCPRCFYLKHVLRLTDKEGRAGLVGSAVHDALKEFIGRWRDADAEGRPLDPADLHRLGRNIYLDKVRGRPDEHELAQVLALLSAYEQQFHDAAAHVLEIERQIRVPYELDGRTHYLTAKIDRVDRVEGAGGFRIIDYKTGAARESLLQPKDDDLQMGIYAIAWAHHLQNDGEHAGPVAGVAEYWLLAGRQRGTIGLDRLNLPKVRKRIDKTITGILSGDFRARCRGEGECALLGAG